MINCDFQHLMDQNIAYHLRDPSTYSSFVCINVLNNLLNELITSSELY